jgi:DNA-binding LacI/PurR family transcriptional regulator
LEVGVPATIKDIALELGISHMTVSRALRGHPHVKEEIRAKVLETARKLDYHPNALARGLKGMRTQLVGLIITDLENHFTASAATALQAELSKNGYRLLLCVTGDEPANEIDYLRAMREERVEGLIWVPCAGSHSEEAIQQYIREGIPVVQFIRQAYTELDAILPDDVGGAEQATRRLLDLGHTRIGIIVGPQEISTARGRLDGYMSALRSASVEPDESLIVSGRLHRSTGKKAVEKLLALPSPPSALFATSSVLLLGALRALHQRGTRIPQDLSVVGFGDPDWCCAWSPSITTVAFATQDMAKAVVQILLKRIRERSIEVTHHPVLSRFGFELEVRESDGPLLLKSRR